MRAYFDESILKMSGRNINNDSKAFKVLLHLFAHFVYPVDAATLTC